LDDLPRFSPWPARLLGESGWQRGERTPDDTIREYDTEKWATLLTQIEAKAGVRLDDADLLAQGGDAVTLMSVGDSLIEVRAIEAHRRYRDWIAAELARYLPAAALVELGAGYGSIIVDLAKRSQFRTLEIIAADLTGNGVRLIDLLARAEDVGISVGSCDLTKTPVTEMRIPEGALIYTSYAAQCIPMLAESFVTSLSALHPKVVVHFEPAYEHCDEKTLLGLMRRRYIQVNDYNTNLITLLREQQGRGRIEIVDERPALFGTNPLLPASLTAWRPRIT
jgi:hypothetical protein